MKYIFLVLAMVMSGESLAFEQIEEGRDVHDFRWLTSEHSYYEQRQAAYNAGHNAVTAITEGPINANTDIEYTYYDDSQKFIQRATADIFLDMQAEFLRTIVDAQYIDSIRYKEVNIPRAFWEIKKHTDNLMAVCYGAMDSAMKGQARVNFNVINDEYDWCVDTVDLLVEVNIAAVHEAAVRREYRMAGTMLQQKLVAIHRRHSLYTFSALKEITSALYTVMVKWTATIK